VENLDLAYHAEDEYSITMLLFTYHLSYSIIFPLVNGKYDTVNKYLKSEQKMSVFNKKNNHKKKRKREKLFDYLFLIISLHFIKINTLLSF